MVFKNLGESGKTKVSFSRPGKFIENGIFGQGLKKFWNFMMMVSR